MTDRVTFEFAGHSMEGEVVDEFLEATYGHEPERVLRVATDSGSYRVPATDATVL
jgi:hypothetical protein